MLGGRKLYLRLVIPLLLIFCYLMLSKVAMKSSYSFATSWKNIFELIDLRSEMGTNDSSTYTSYDKNLPRILVVLGTRPEAIKCAPLIAELKSDQYRTRFHVIVLSTGQHRQILRQTLNVFHQTIDIDLDLMEHDQKLTNLFGRIFSGVTEKINAIQPRLVIVQGDTLTALAASLAAAYHPVPVAHVEAGLRSFDLSNPYPEELNRKTIDGISKLLFAPTTFAKEALLREGACETDIFVTGNTGVDAFYHYQKRVNATLDSVILRMIETFKKATVNGTTILVTMHRRENFNHMADMCRAIATIAGEHGANVLIILPVHPNPNVKKVVMAHLGGLESVKIVEPISYEIFGSVLLQSDIVLTDSGGIQEEATSIGKPVILMRTTTERPEGIYLGTIQQIGVIYEDIVRAVNSTLISSKSPNQTRQLNIFGDGTASKKIATIIDAYLYDKPRLNPKCSTKFRQDAIASAVYPTANVSQANLPSHPVRRRTMENLTKVRPSISLDELLKLPSRYKPGNNSDAAFSLTAVIGVYKRDGLIRRWIEALMAQTHPPTEIWIVYFASPISSKLNREIDEARLLFKNGSTFCHEWCTQNSGNKVNASFECLKRCETLPSIVFVAMGEMQLKYFGRFQLALQCRTKYLVVFDDDCIPQARYFETAMHTINTAEYRGILGSKGTAAVVANVFYGAMSKTSQIIEADVVGGSWFMEAEWAKLMFHDKIHSWNTAEDFHLCANARKYANVRSFVMPVDGKDSSTHSFAGDYMDISMRGDTTGRVPGTESSRYHVRDQLWLRGDRLMHSYRETKPSLLLFAETHSDAMLLLTHSRPEMIKLGGSLHFATSNIAKTDLNTTEIRSAVGSFHDFMVGRDFGMDPTPITASAEVLYAFDMVMQGTQSTAVLVVGSSSTVALFALVSAAFLREIPILNVYLPGNITDLRRAQAIVAMSSVTLRNFDSGILAKSVCDQLNDLLIHLYK